MFPKGHTPRALGALIATLGAAGIFAQDSPNLSEEEMRHFLLRAEVVQSKQLSKGVTHAWRLTLSDGRITHDAGFQSVDEYKAVMLLSNGKTEMGFRDSYKYNIAAYELAKLLGLADMMPVTVERTWNRRPGSLSWWLPVKMDDEKRLKDHLEPPDLQAWNNQMWKMLVFGQLVYDTDRNPGNVLISADWHIWMIDFTRAFRRWDKLENPRDLTHCDRQLMDKLRKLDGAELQKKTEGYLTPAEVKGVMMRRDRIVALFDDLIARQGEQNVLY